MQRREFIRTSAAAILGTKLLDKSCVCAEPSTSDLDRYGGWKGKRFAATGFFRVEKDTRWWLVTPAGNGFLSWGINHLYPDLWKQDYNRETWKKTAKGWFGYEIEELGGRVFINGEAYEPKNGD